MRIVLAILCLLGHAHADPAAATITGMVADPYGVPLAGATVLILGPSGFEQHSETDRRGEYRVTLKSTGKYHVVFTGYRSHDSRSFIVKPGSANRADGNLDPSTGEVIVIHDPPPPPVIATAPPRRKLPAYSDYAIVHNTWTRAWLLLDIDETGKVLRFKFLKRPGADLEGIAASYVFGTTFEPARDGSGRAIRSRLVWDLEWPSHSWLIARTGVAAGIPPSIRYVPCAGSGPLNLDMAAHDSYDRTLTSGTAMYRDCSMPKLTPAHTEAWIEPK